ncbi:hypothetical protein WUBG_19171, partial [Wuchereria bancrofti]
RERLLFLRFRFDNEERAEKVWRGNDGTAISVGGLLSITDASSACHSISSLLLGIFIRALPCRLSLSRHCHLARTAPVFCVSDLITRNGLRRCGGEMTGLPYQLAVTDSSVYREISEMTTNGA